MSFARALLTFLFNNIFAFPFFLLCIWNVIQSRDGAIAEDYFQPFVMAWEQKYRAH